MDLLVVQLNMLVGRLTVVGSDVGDVGRVGDAVGLYVVVWK